MFTTCGQFVFNGLHDSRGRFERTTRAKVFQVRPAQTSVYFETGRTPAIVYDECGARSKTSRLYKPEPELGNSGARS